MQICSRTYEIVFQNSDSAVLSHLINFLTSVESEQCVLFLNTCAENTVILSVVIKLKVYPLRYAYC